MHEEEVSDLVYLESDGVQHGLDVVHLHLEHAHCVLIELLHLVPLVGINVVVIVIILRILDLYLEPDSLVAPTRVAVIKTDSVVSILLNVSDKPAI